MAEAMKLSFADRSVALGDAPSEAAQAHGQLHAGRAGIGKIGDEKRFATLQERSVGNVVEHSRHGSGAIIMRDGYEFHI